MPSGMCFCLFFCVSLGIISTSPAFEIVANQERVFEIDYTNNRFLKDGEPFRYISGSLHYFRVPRAYWRDRLQKYKAAGLNAISTYVEWKRHEPVKGTYDFSGENDIEYFIRLAAEEEMLVILRPGPYICAERDFGGYPPWLLHENPEMYLRTSDPSHTKYVYSWLSVLFPRIQPLLYGNGGPIIMVQVENEYGSYDACDHNYTRWLRDVFRGYVGDKAVLFTTDGNSADYLKCGPIPGVFITVDFGPSKNVSADFLDLRKKQPHGPLVNSEFYPGWLTAWGEEESGVSTEAVVNSVKQLMALNASFNFYMFHGGTNFGFESGADPPFSPVITSYDYNAPISESGNLTEKYFAIKNALAEFQEVKNVTLKTGDPVGYGTVQLYPKTSLFESDLGTKYGTFPRPMTFESLQLYNGFMLYETTLPKPKTAMRYLEVYGIHDRALVYVDGISAGVLSRRDMIPSILLSTSGQKLSLLVENEGHINYKNMSDLKGIVGNVTINGDLLTNWNHTGFPLSNVSVVASLPTVKDVRLPGFYTGVLEIPSGEEPKDTFVDMTGWGKGVLYVNDYNLGRYWPVMGPQITLYLPAPFLKQRNTFTVFELQSAHPDRTIKLVDKPELNGTSVMWSPNRYNRRRFRRN